MQQSYRSIIIKNRINWLVEKTFPNLFHSNIFILDRLLTTLFNTNTKKFLDNLSAESSTNSSGIHSKSTTTELGEITFSSKYEKPKLFLNRSYHYI